MAAKQAQAAVIFLHGVEIHPEDIASRGNREDTPHVAMDNLARRLGMRQFNSQISRKNRRMTQTFAKSRHNDAGTPVATAKPGCQTLNDVRRNHRQVHGVNKECSFDRHVT